MAPGGVEVEVAEGRSIVGRGEVGAGAYPLASAPL
jgi:hypothetical protein